MIDLTSPYFWLALGLFLLVYYSLVLFSFYRDKLNAVFGKGKQQAQAHSTLPSHSGSADNSKNLGITPSLLEAFAAYRDYLRQKHMPLKDFPVLLQEPYRGIIKTLETNYKSTKLNS